MIRHIILSFIFSFFSVVTLQAQQPAFLNEIQEFKKRDSLNPPPKNAIVFVGSSSFRMWNNVQEMFPGYTIINRGFGGSSLPDVIRYANDIIVPYQPSQVVIYCGDNDLAASDTVTSQIVFDRFRHLFDTIRQHLPNTAIAFVSIKPSPSRANLLQKVVAANNLIREFLKKQP